MIWVEILDRRHDVLARHRCQGAVVRIGRGYDNDVVVDDPFVAPAHLRVVRGEDGTLLAEDLDSEGGLFVEGTDRRSRVALDGDRVLRIGRTLLRVREASHPVPPERVAPVLPLWPVALSLAIAALGLETLGDWLAQTGEFSLSAYAVPIGILAVLTVLWTSGWAVLARIFSGQARFERNLVIALTALLALELLEEGVDAGAFAFSSRLLADYSYAGTWTVFCVACFFHLREVTPARPKVKAMAVFGLGAAAIAAQTLAQSEMRSWFSRGSYLRGLKPPFFRVVQPQNDVAFFADAEHLQPLLERAREEEPSGAGLPDIDPFD